MSSEFSAKKQWQKFCSDLMSAGEAVLDDDIGETERDAAESIRYLTRLTRVGLDMHLEHADPQFPSFYQASHETAKIGADNPDNLYQNATVSGELEYRIWGTRGTVPIFSIGTKANRYAINGTMSSTGELDSVDMEISGDGSFEIIVSKSKKDKNWLPLENDSSMVIVRQTFMERANETAAEVFIEAINSPAHPTSLDANQLETSLINTAAFVRGTSATFLDWAKRFKASNKNQLNTVDQSMFFKAGGDPTIFYLHGWWELGNREALLIQFTPPECEGWNFQLNNVWMESLDYRHHQIHVNNKTTTSLHNGVVSLIVTNNPERIPEKFHPFDMIETTGHRHGTMLLRWTGAQSHPIPHTEVISIDA